MHIRLNTKIFLGLLIVKLKNERKKRNTEIQRVSERYLRAIFLRFSDYLKESVAND